MAVKEILIADENDADIYHATKEVDLLRSLRNDHVVKYLGSYVDMDAKKLFIFTVSCNLCRCCLFVGLVNGKLMDVVELCQEWVPGGNLEQNRKRFGCNEALVRRFTHQILRGVAYLHSKNIVHHDIKVSSCDCFVRTLIQRPPRSVDPTPRSFVKPSNILVDQHGVVKLADFGASRLISSSTSVNNESMRGTPNYMAPEVIKQTTRSRKSDIWSVGCSVLRLLTGLPFWGDKKFDSQISLLYYVAHLETLPPLPGELSGEARSFVAACLEIDPALRPSAMELLQHPFVNLFDPNAPPPPRSARVQSAPPTVDNFNRSQAATKSSGISQPASVTITAVAPATTTKRALNSAPSHFNLPRLRNAATKAPVRQDPYMVPPALPNAFDPPVRRSSFAFVRIRAGMEAHSCCSGCTRRGRKNPETALKSRSRASPRRSSRWTPYRCLAYPAATTPRRRPRSNGCRRLVRHRGRVTSILTTQLLDPREQQMQRRTKR